MSDYLVHYPKTVGLMQGLRHLIRKDNIGKESLYVVVKNSAEEVVRVLRAEGFHRLRFCENKTPTQLGSGFTKMLNKTWEMHVRLYEMKNGLVAIQGEVEISRRYFLHMFSQRAPVVYEIANILKKNGMQYRLWNESLNAYVSKIIDNHQIRLKVKLKGMPGLLPWIPTCVVVLAYGVWRLLWSLGIV